MSNKEISLRVENLCSISSCITHNHKILDYFHFFSYEFKNYNIYGIVNSFGSGGQALTNVLSGYEENYQGEIFLNNIKISSKELKNITFCVESNPKYIKKRLFRKNNVITYLKSAIEKNIDFKDKLENIIKVFGLERLNHDIRYTSGEKWRSLLALGYCMGRKVFCFNWYNYWELRYFYDQYRVIFNYLKDNGCIVIIPTDRTEGIEGLFDSVVHTSNNMEDQLNRELNKQIKDN